MFVLFFGGRKNVIANTQNVRKKLITFCHKKGSKLSPFVTSSILFRCKKMQCMRSCIIFNFSKKN